MSLIERGDKAINERYRPQRFSEIIGCDKIKNSLNNWMNLGEKRSKVLLMSGASGSGKTTLSRIIAMGLNCEHGDTVEPCLECSSCKAAMSGEAMHISEYNMSALTCKDDADGIVQSMSDSCFTGRNRVFILDEIQGISVGSQNLMLKTLENPPPNTYVILATTNPEKLLKTVKSRCEQYEFKNPGRNEIASLLGSVVKNEMPSMGIEQRKEIMEACIGLSYREILMKLDKFIKGGGTDSIGEAFQADYVSFAKIVISGKFLEAIDYIEKNKDDFDVEAARRILRTFISNQVIYSMKNRTSIQPTQYAKMFQFFDKGFYTDPNPMPSFKIDLFNAISILKS